MTKADNLDDQLAAAELLFDACLEAEPGSRTQLGRSIGALMSGFKRLMYHPGKRLQAAGAGQEVALEFMASTAQAHAQLLAETLKQLPPGLRQTLFAVLIPMVAEQSGAAVATVTVTPPDGARPPTTH